jgi:hypothetical protein
MKVFLVNLHNFPSLSPIYVQRNQGSEKLSSSSTVKNLVSDSTKVYRFYNPCIIPHQWTQWIGKHKGCRKGAAIMWGNKIVEQAGNIEFKTEVKEDPFQIHTFQRQKEKTYFSETGERGTLKIKLFSIWKWH